VTIRNGKARIVEFGSVLGWLERHGPLLEHHLEALGQNWKQRITARTLARRRANPAT
jgi:branched-chain amino acid transport system substrate-binding protein